MIRAVLLSLVLLLQNKSVFAFQSPTVRSVGASKPSTAIGAGNSKTEKRPWEFFRFLKQANFFNWRPKFLKSSGADKGLQMMRPGSVLWSAKDAGGVSWGPLDDVVMGGASKTDLAPGEPFSGKWTGIVTTANNGGFAGIRTKLLNPFRDASGCSGILLKVKGDGQRYKLIARDDEDWNGTAWSASFDTDSGRSKEIRVPFNKLKPTRFARTIDPGRPYNSKQMTGLQLTLSKFEYDGGLNPSFREGPFCLEVDEIGFY